MATNKTANVPAEDEEWEDVVTEIQVIMDSDGDEFVGKLLGWSATEGKNIPQAHFEGRDGKTYFINCGWSLKQQLKPVKTGTWCKLTRTGTQDTGQDTPMVLFRVQTKK